MLKRGLGRGLDALLSNDLDLQGDIQQVCQLSPAVIKAAKEQPRKNFDQEALQELADSIREHGMLQPILVRPNKDGYEIIAGERRFRAAQVAGLTSIPAIIREIDDTKAAEISLVENIQRDDLTVLEEGYAYRNMIDSYGYTQEMLAAKIGKSRAHVANTVRILTLPPEIIKMIEHGQLTAGHARSIMALAHAKEQVAAAKEIISEKLSVRATEKRIKLVIERKKKFPVKEIEIAELEEKLEKHFGTKAEIIDKRQGGKIEITYFNEEDLERIVELMGIK
ncbi:MAG: ParB/RepB/Spo0J family partition protein [Syntrophomonadaceae bacterium]|nr:ParB/RepB/Spo0J family partition protein [Syntrophomonadaceae bacterium]